MLKSEVYPHRHKLLLPPAHARKAPCPHPGEAGLWAMQDLDLPIVVGQVAFALIRHA